MATNSAKILDLGTFRKHRDEEPKYTENGSLIPVLVWVPVWVFVPQQY